MEDHSASNEIDSDDNDSVSSSNDTYSNNDRENTSHGSSTDTEVENLIERIVDIAGKKGYVYLFISDYVKKENFIVCETCLHFGCNCNKFKGIAEGYNLEGTSVDQN